MSHRDTILHLFTLYCAVTGRSPARVSTLVWNHGARHRQIVAGADLRTRTFERALRWFSDHWPEELAWPQGIARPVPEREDAAAPAAPLDSKGRELSAAMALGANGRLRSPTALCKALRIRRSTYDYVIRRYADARDRADAFPQRNTWSRRLLEVLVASGDARFAKRRRRLEKAAEIGRRLFQMSAPGKRPGKKQSADPATLTATHRRYLGGE